MNDIDLYNERLLVANETLIKAYESIDFNADDASDRLRAAADMHKQIVKDGKAVISKDIEAGKNETAVEIAKVNNKAESRNTIIKVALGILQAGAMVFATVYSERQLNKRFKISSKFEESDAYLSTTDHTTAMEGLKPRKSGFGGFFK